MEKKDTVDLSRHLAELGRRGGKKASEKLTKAERSARAAAASRARWGKKGGKRRAS